MAPSICGYILKWKDSLTELLKSDILIYSRSECRQANVPCGRQEEARRSSEETQWQEAKRDTYVGRYWWELFLKFMKISSFE